MTNTAPTGDGYFYYHSIGQFPGKAEAMAAALSNFAAIWGRPDDAQWGPALDLKARFQALWSQLIGAPEGTVTSCESVTGALYSIIGALPAGVLKDRVFLIAGDCFPSLHFLLNGLQARFGFILRTVPIRPGEHWVRDEDVIAAWGPEVGVALLTLVSSTASSRPDHAALVAHGRAQGSVIGVDITQGAGIVPYDVNAPAIDFSVSTSLKWMCGAPGAGIIHVSPGLIGDCRPEFRGWFSQDNPFSWDLDAFDYAPDIRRFDNGTPSILAACASIPGLEWFLAQDRAALIASNRAMCARIIEGAEAMGLKLASPRDPARRGGSVMLDMGATARAAAALAALHERGIHADHRSNILRLSPGYVTTDAGVTRLLDTLAAQAGKAA